MVDVLDDPVEIRRRNRRVRRAHYAVRRAHRSAKASATNGDGTFFSTQEVSDTVDPRLSLKIHPKAAMLDSFFQAASEHNKRVPRGVPSTLGSLFSGGCLISDYGEGGGVSEPRQRHPWWYTDRSRRGPTMLANRGSLRFEN
ncbi:hypothetical protein F2Q68_00016113 [Brassica cretica]|uniref:Uncharacterized protein n=1 Tax=Brassica cretica TaxID=69181 RepID=A0A8S9HDK4_BRACR|nr:hypothetical protein F2Q68_00016113 [Brassica cretica]